MFMVAPSGITKPEVEGLTLSVSRTQVIAVGRVALLELVENAVMRTGRISLKNWRGERLVQILRNTLMEPKR